MCFKGTMLYYGEGGHFFKNFIFNLEMVKMARKSVEFTETINFAVRERTKLCQLMVRPMYNKDSLRKTNKRA